MKSGEYIFVKPIITIKKYELKKTLHGNTAWQEVISLRKLR